LADSEVRLKALMVAALADDGGAYRMLLTEVGGHLRAYYARQLGSGAADLEDLVQQVLIAMHTKRATYDTTQPFTPWVYAIARYKLIDHFRRSGRRRAVPLDEAGELFVESNQEAAVARRDVDQLLARLPKRTRDLLLSVKVEGLSTQEAAVRSGMSESAVKVAVHRALRSLTSILKGESGH
jgi:RNA polymerase sigma-70 factor (ECF subfamily)